MLSQSGGCNIQNVVIVIDGHFERFVPFKKF